MQTQPFCLNMQKNLQLPKTSLKIPCFSSRTSWYRMQIRYRLNLYGHDFQALQPPFTKNDNASAGKFFFANAVLADERIPTQGYRHAGMYPVNTLP